MAKAQSDSEAVVKRAPRRRVPRKTTRVKTVVSESVEETVTEAVPRRKSPTQLSPEPKVSSRKPNRTALASILGVVGCSILGVLIGMSDSGPIDINAVITQQSVVSSEAAPSGDNTQSDPVTIPVQSNTSNLPSGGLMPSTDQPIEPVLPTATSSIDGATSTATSTEEGTATSTDEVAPETEETTTSETETSTSEPVTTEESVTTEN